jgi:hypothetical protein
VEWSSAVEWCGAVEYTGAVERSGAVGLEIEWVLVEVHREIPNMGHRGDEFHKGREIK